MDKVPLTSDVPSNTIVDNKDSKTITIKTSSHEKTYYTVVLSCCADGTKLPPMIILKRKTVPKDEISQGIVLHVQDKSWMDENGMKLWLEKVWAKHPGGLLEKPSGLVCDQFKSHVTEATKREVKELNLQLAIIPRGLTSQLQPLDVFINKPFKVTVHEEWTKWVSEPNRDLTPTGQMKRLTIMQVCDWVKTSWQSVKEEIVMKSFKKYSISNAFDGTEDDLLFEDIENENLDYSAKSESENEV